MRTLLNDHATDAELLDAVKTAEDTGWPVRILTTGAGWAQRWDREAALAARIRALAITPLILTGAGAVIVMPAAWQHDHEVPS